MGVDQSKENVKKRIEYTFNKVPRPNFDKALHVFNKLLSNIIKNPTDPKYRRIPLNRTMQSSIMLIDQMDQIFLDLGFKEEESSGSLNRAFVLPLGSSLDLVRVAYDELAPYVEQLPPQPQIVRSPNPPPLPAPSGLPAPAPSSGAPPQLSSVPVKVEASESPPPGEVRRPGPPSNGRPGAGPARPGERPINFKISGIGLVGAVVATPGTHRLLARLVGVNAVLTPENLSALIVIEGPSKLTPSISRPQARGNAWYNIDVKPEIPGEYHFSFLHPFSKRIVRQLKITFSERKEPLQDNLNTKTPPKDSSWIWRTGSFAGIFGDSFIRNTELEGGLVSPSIRSLIFSIKLLLEDQSLFKRYLNLFNEGDVTGLHRILEVLQDAAAIGDKLSQLRKSIHLSAINQLNQLEKPKDSVPKYIEEFSKRVRSMKPGEVILVPGGWEDPEGGHAVAYIVQCEEEDRFGFCVSNSGEGVNYHPSNSNDYPKLKAMTTIRMGNIKRHTISDPAIWYVLFKLKLAPKKENLPEILYEVVLPHLIGLPVISAALLTEGSEGNCGDWKSLQRSGTCYMKCITTALSYLCRDSIGLSSVQIKQLFCAIRISYLVQTSQDMDILYDQYTKGVRKSQKEKDSYPAESTGDHDQTEIITPQRYRYTHRSAAGVHGWQHSDATMVQIACRQTGIAAVKLHDMFKEACNRETLNYLNEFVKSIMDRVNVLNGIIDAKLQKKVDFDELLAASPLNTFEGFELLYDERDTEQFAGYDTEAPPELFVDLMDPSSPIVEFKDILALLELSVLRCNHLRAKTSVSAVTLAMYQTSTYIDHLFSSLLPVPNHNYPKSPCHWRGATLTNDEQHRALYALFMLSQHYLAAVCSLTPSPFLYSTRAIILSTILTCFDAVLRAKATDRTSPVSDILVARNFDGQEDPAAEYWPSLDLFCEDSFDFVKNFEEMLVVAPEMVALRRTVVDYWNRKKEKMIFKGWKMEHSLKGRKKVIPLSQNDNTILFLREILKKTRSLEKLPGDTWEEHEIPEGFESFRYYSDSGVATPEVERIGVWFCAISPWTSNPANLPEFGQYRDLILLTKLFFANNLEEQNKGVFTPDKVWFTRQLCPTWICKETDPTKTFVYIHFTITGEEINFSTPPEISPKRKCLSQFSTLSEDAILYSDNIETFNDTLSEEDAEKLSEFLIVPNLSIPLVLSFFSDNRVGTLLNRDLRFILNCVLFQPGPIQKEASDINTAIPLHEQDHLGTELSLLIDEVTRAPDPIFHPLLKLLKQTFSLCISDYKSVFVSLLLYLIQNTVHIMNFRKWVLNNRSNAAACTVWEELLAYLSTTIVPFLKKCFEESGQDISSSVSFHSHMILIHNFCPDKVAEEILSMSYVSAWHSRTTDVQRKKPSKQIVKVVEEKNQEFLTLPLYEVFVSLQKKRADFVNWSENTPPAIVSKTLERILVVLTRHKEPDNEIEVDRLWERSKAKPPLCSKVIESMHPYKGATDFYEFVSFPGTTSITIYFDKASKTGGIHDFLAIYQDESFKTTWGPSKITGNWPGTEGRPPLVIPADSFWVHFHGDPTSKSAYGFKFLSTAPICSESVSILYEEFKNDKNFEQDSLVHYIQKALAKANNEIEKARQIITKKEISENMIDKDELVRGLYIKTAQEVQFNLQTSELFFNNRMLIPLPLPIRSRPEIHSLFPSNIPLYTEIRFSKQHCKLYQLYLDEFTYEIYSWGPLPLLNHEVAVAEKLNPSRLTEGSSQKSDAEILEEYYQKVLSEDEEDHVLYWGAPKIVEDKIHYCGKVYVKWEKEDWGRSWIGRVFEYLLQDAREWNVKLRKVLQERPKLWMLEEIVEQIKSGNKVDKPTDVFGWILMFVGPQGAYEEIYNYPGVFYEIRVLEDLQVLHFYALIENGRRTYRSLVYTSNNRLSYAYLPQEPKPRQYPWIPHTEHSAGNMFQYLFNKTGELVDRPGSGHLSDSKVSTLEIRRKKLSQLEDVWETYVPNLVGLIPEVLWQGYKFWKTGSIITGYPSGDEWFSNSLIEIELNDTNKKRAVIRHISKNGEKMVLHNILNAVPGSTLAKLATVFSEIESLSHVLVWSRSNASPGEEAELSLIELPRLKLRFSVRISDDGQTRFYSLDHDGLFISKKQHNLFTPILPHSLILENQFREYFILVPNYELDRVEIECCPFSTSIITRCSQFWTTINSRYYILPLHSSESFVKTNSLAAALYIAVVGLYRRNYNLSARYIATCSTDTPLNEEEKWIIFMAQGTRGDAHPDAHACRMRLALIAFESGETKIPWDLSDDISQYYLKISNVSAVCKLTLEEEEALLKFKDNPVQLRYIQALRESKETGNSVVLPLPEKRIDNGGYKVYCFYGLAKRINLEKCQLYYAYARETVEAGDGALDLLTTFWDDHVIGDFYKTGFLLLYDMLIGKRHLFITNEDAVGKPVKHERTPFDGIIKDGSIICKKCGFQNEKVGANFSMNCVACDSPFLEDKEMLENAIMEEREGKRDMCSSINLIKLLLHGSIVKAIKQEAIQVDLRKPMNRIQATNACALAVVTALLLATENDLRSATNINFTFPSIPLSTMSEKFEEGFYPFTFNEIDKFPEFSKFQSTMMKSVAKVFKSDFLKENRMYRPLPPPISGTSQIRVMWQNQANFSSVADTSCNLRILKNFNASDSEGVLKLDSKDVQVFSTVPLEQITTNHVQYEIRENSGIQSLPVDLSSHSVANTVAAKNTLNRMSNDIKLSYNQKTRIPTLKYLNSNHFEMLNKEIEKLDAKESLSLSSSSKISRSSTSILCNAVSQLVSLKESLSQIQTQDSDTITKAIHQLELITNTVKPKPPKSTELANEYYSSKQLKYIFHKRAGKIVNLNFSGLSKVLVSNNALEDLQKGNYFLDDEKCAVILQSIAAILLRSIRLSQVNLCISSVIQLQEKIMDFLKLQVEIKYLKRTTSFPFVPSHEMIIFSLKQCSFNVKESISFIHRMNATMEKLANDEKLNFAGLAIEKRLTVAYIAWHMVNFDESKCIETLSTIDAETILSLARRGCFWKGKKLHVPVSEKKHYSDQSVASLLKAMVHVIIHTSSSLAADLAHGRFYTNQAEKEKDIYHYDPRFLVFEFISNFMLRERQVTLVNEFVKAAKFGSSSVHQMIMGAGKTTVICPLLILILADGKSLITQVVPQSLLAMSRDILRTAFSQIIPKKIFTFSFDRSQPTGKDFQEMYLSMQEIYLKFQRTRRERGVLCTTPESVKSFMLKYIDLLASVANANDLLRIPAQYTLSSSSFKELHATTMQLNDFEKIADKFRDVIQLWGKSERGIALLDEVDLILHPLKSELNFPIGEKKTLTLNPQRFQYPMHLLDVLVYRDNEKLSDQEFRPGPQHIKLLRSISSALAEGERISAMQQHPHSVLLDTQFYEKTLKNLFTEWSFVWLERQNQILEGIQSALKDGFKDVKDVLLKYITKPSSEDTLLKYFSSEALSLMNLVHEWLVSFLPHCLSKINRIGYGLLQPNSNKMQSEHLTLSRTLLAVPFIGKDCPTSSSEFAHPEVLIGLSVLAYRYEGLRETDLKRLVKKLKEDMAYEPGPVSERPSYVRFHDWILTSNISNSPTLQPSLITSTTSQNQENTPKTENEEGEEEEKLEDESAVWSMGTQSTEILPLDLFQPDDASQLSILMRFFSKKPEVINYYLEMIVFPLVLRHQVTKLQASGQDLGSNMLFGTRLGFSGTPSDVLPYQLRPCHYEPESEAKIINVLTSNTNVTFEVVIDSRVESLLNHIATANPSYNALIDSGALITGLSNEQVARALLEKGLKDKEACVFINSDDVKMVVDRSGGPPIPLSRAGVSVDHVFTFYDQVHTTGMDIKQSINACALVTLGKDMTWRDFAQGCWRMRGLGKGQTVHVLITKEVQKLICDVNSGNGDSLKVEMSPLRIFTWLLYNTLISEQLQYMQSSQQNIYHFWRQRSFQLLLESFARNRPVPPNPEEVDPSSPLLFSRFDGENLKFNEKEITDILERNRNFLPKIQEKNQDQMEDEELDTEEIEVPEDFQAVATTLHNLIAELMELNMSPKHQQLWMNQVLALQSKPNADTFKETYILGKRLSKRYQPKNEPPPPAVVIPPPENHPTTHSYSNPVVLRECIKIFQEPVNLDSALQIQKTQSWTNQLELQINNMLTFLVDVADKNNLMQIFKEMKEFHYDDVNSQQNVKNKDYNAEMVQEQEQEREQQREKKTDNHHLNNLTTQTHYWRYSDLFDGNILKLFYPLREFSFPNPLPFPESLYVSPNHTLFLASSQSQYRLKNVTVLLIWSPNSLSIDKTTSNDPSPQPKDQIQNSTPTKWLVSIITLKEASVIRHLLYSAHLPSSNVYLVTTNGIWLTLPPISPLNVNKEIQSARFFNAGIKFSVSELLEILAGLKEAPEMERKAFFEKVLGARRRTNMGWENSTVAQVWKNRDDTTLTKIRDNGKIIRDKILKSGKTLSTFFQENDVDSDGFISVTDILTVLKGLSVDIPDNTLAELITLADQNMDGYLNLRDFLSQFSMDAEEIEIKNNVEEAKQQKQLDNKPSFIHRHTKSVKFLPSKKKSTTNQREFRGVSEIGQVSLVSGLSLVISEDNLVYTNNKNTAQVSFSGDMAKQDILPFFTKWSSESTTVSSNWVYLNWGVWYYEVTIVEISNNTSLNGVIGWGEQDTQEQERWIVGIGDDGRIWGTDETNLATKFMEKWTTGDVLCCAVDIDNRECYFTLNGEWSDISKRKIPIPSGKRGISPVALFNCNLRFRMNFGEYPFSYNPLPQFHSLHEWICSAREYVFSQVNKKILGQIYALSGSSVIQISHRSISNTRRSGFPSIALGGVIAVRGKWYYEIILQSDAVAQIGWTDLFFKANSKAGFGVGDDKHSWAYDGNRLVLWHGEMYAKKWGIRWRTGDVIGCAADLDNRTLSFSHNGKWDKPMGVAYKNISFVGGLQPALVCARDFMCRMNFAEAGSPFSYSPPSPEYRPVADLLSFYQSAKDLDSSIKSRLDLQPEKPKKQENGLRSGVKVRSGVRDASIENTDGKIVIMATNNYPTIVIEGCLVTKGHFYYEVVLQRPKTKTNNKIVEEAFAVVGIVNRKFIGSSTLAKGVGDDVHSWGLNNLGLSSGAANNWTLKATKTDHELNVKPLVFGCSINIEGKEIVWNWTDDVAFYTSKENIETPFGWNPAISIQSGVQADINIGGQPFLLPIPEGAQPLIQIYNSNQ